MFVIDDSDEGIKFLMCVLVIFRGAGVFRLGRGEERRGRKGVVTIFPYKAAQYN